MEIIPIEELVKLITADFISGKLYWLYRGRSFFNNDGAFKSWNTRYAGKEAFIFNKDGYKRGSVNYNMLYEHRVIWALYYGEWPSTIDHINCDRSDNRISNLRLATRSQNGANSSNKINKFGYKGVVANRNGFRAQLRKDGKTYISNNVKTPKEAHEDYVKLSLKYHGEFANFGNQP